MSMQHPVHSNLMTGQRRTAPRLLIATAALCGFALTACAASGDQSPPESPETPRAGEEPTPQFWIEEHSEEDLHFLVQYAEIPEGAEVGYHEALVEGELTADDQTGCIGLIPDADETDTDGADGELVIPVFPEGTELIDEDTLYVPTNNGGELQFGDQVGFGGSETHPDRVEEIAEDELTCNADHYWGVNPEL